mmetsp:Transcript_32242/g.110950  ORF Transcript_32242/g.110950 Transcript_32242/m.110950 type:complete len:263 (-) Transcript_32242:938-1726(-)
MSRWCRVSTSASSLAFFAARLSAKSENASAPHASSNAPLVTTPQLLDRSISRSVRSRARPAREERFVCTPPPPRSPPSDAFSRIVESQSETSDLTSASTVFAGAARRRSARIRRAKARLDAVQPWTASRSFFQSASFSSSQTAKATGLSHSKGASNASPVLWPPGRQGCVALRRCASARYCRHSSSVTSPEDSSPSRSSVCFWRITSFSTAAAVLRLPLRSRCAASLSEAKRPSAVPSHFCVISSTQISTSSRETTSYLRSS